MKNRLGIIVLTWAVCWMVLFSSTSTVSAQSQFFGGPGAPGPGGQVFEPGAFQAVQSELGSSVGWPGRLWVSSNFSEEGLGYEGSYLTLGAKTRLFEDGLDGRWLFEGRGHISEEGGFFGNFGVERVFSIDAAGADVSLGAFFDYDDDQGGFAFANTLEAWGVSGKIKTRHWDLFANGYFPIGSSDTTQGDPNGGTSFFGNSVALVPGFDSALQGFDVTVRTRPSQLAFVNGSFDFGGYGYGSDLVDFFGGGRMRLNLQILRGAIFTGEINYDDRFDVTGLLGLTFLWGAGGGRGHEYSGIGRDLERTVRNDHIVRFNQNVIAAIDPDTGLPYNVIHVNNLADPNGDGSFESPFDTLEDAEAGSGPDDIIFVDVGDGTTNGHENGITLQDGQLFLGEGVPHLITIANGPGFGDVFELITNQDGIRPTITGSNNGAAVTLANRNTVRGFVIDGSAASGGMSNGIVGNPGTINTDGIIEDNMITGAILNGISINNLAGDWTFARNDIQDNGFSGISLVNACDPSSVFTFDSNIVSNNTIGSGIEIINYDAAELIFTNNVTDGNGGDGVLLQNFKGDQTLGVDIAFDGHIARNNTGAGINIDGGAGNITITNSIIGDDIGVLGLLTADGNIGGGITITDFTTPGADDQILISGNEINGNGGGASPGINLELTSGFARALITGNQIDGNGIGIRAFADTTPTGSALLEVDVLNNVSVGSFAGGGNVGDGLQFIASGNSSLVVNVDQAGDELPIFLNGDNGLSLLSDGAASLTARVNNVTASFNGIGVFGQTRDSGQLTLLVEDSFIGNDDTALLDGNGTGFLFDFDNDGPSASGITLPNTVIIRNVTASDNVGSALIFNTGTGTFTDIAITGSSFDNPFLLGARTDGVFDGANPVGLPDRGFAPGLVFNVTGAGGAGNPAVDNRTRLLFQGNTVDAFVFEGLQVNTFGDASFLADINSNTISNNGDGLDAGGQPDAPFFDGIDFNVMGSSVVNTRIVGNSITGNANSALTAITFNTSTFNGLVTGNNLGDSSIFAGGADVVGVNMAGSNMNLAFSANSVDTSFFLNLGLPADFQLELNGFTNGLTFATPFPMNITQVGFGNVVEPAIDAEEAAFAAGGFPPSPPTFP